MIWTIAALLLGYIGLLVFFSKKSMMPAFSELKPHFASIQTNSPKLAA